MKMRMEDGEKIVETTMVLKRGVEVEEMEGKESVLLQKHSVLGGKYELGRVLGQGTFARVYMARNLITGKSLAMKVVGKEKVVKARMMEQMKREISLMKRVKHPNIVELYEVMASKSKIYLAMELVRGGELFTKVSKGGKLEEDVARSYFRQLISAVDFCHSRGVYHRDLKLENLLLDEQGRLKITDFGLSTFHNVDEDADENDVSHKNQDLLLRTSCGTPHYVAPEVISRRGQGYHGSKADIWSCGIILYTLLAGYLPFHDDNLIRMYRRIYKGDFNCPDWFSPEACSLVTRMLDPNPTTRITVAQIMESDWYSNSMKTKEEERDLYMDFWNMQSDYAIKNKMKEPETLNAFHIISLSQGFDLSPLFEVEEKRRAEADNIRFATNEPASIVISRLQQVADAAGHFHLDKAAGDTVVTLQRQVPGRKGPLTIVAQLFSVSPTLLMVEITKDHGDTFEYNRFCSTQLRPALQDIIWTSPPQVQHTPASTTPAVACS